MSNYYGAPFGGIIIACVIINCVISAVLVVGVVVAVASAVVYYKS